MENSSLSYEELNVQDLSWRELEVLGLLSERLSNKEIGANLHLAESTVKWYNKHIFSKLGVANRKQAVKRAAELDLLTNHSTPVKAEKHQLPNNLPSQIPSFVGRQKEVEDISRLIASSRLVTLTGAGGSGKTRLALQVAKHVHSTFKDGTWLVELAALNDPALVPNEIANVLKLTANSETTYLDMLKHFLERKEVLLVIDNFEHVDAAAPMIAELLASAPGLTVFVTSRSRLDIYGEQEYSLSPLNLPGVNLFENPQDLLKYEAVDLFIQRVKATQPGLTLDDAQIKAIAQICIRLDGLPLAIELSAPLVKIFGVTSLAERLENNLANLPTGPRDLPKRQRTLRATMDWSYQLLSDEDKSLFDRLSVFNGGGTLEAIEFVCAEGNSNNVIDQLASLVEKNLVFPVETSDGELRFNLLETLRNYGHEHLDTPADVQQIYKKHAAYYADLAETSDKEIRGPRNKYWFKHLMLENQNLRSALAWSLDGGELNSGLQMVASLFYHWYYNGLGSEYLDLIELARQKSAEAEPALRLGVLITAGHIAYGLDDSEKSANILEVALELSRQLKDDFSEAVTLLYLCMASIGSSRNVKEVLSMADTALDIFQKHNDIAHIALANNVLGEIMRVQENYTSALEYYQKCLELSKQSGETLREAMQYVNLSFIAFHQGEYKEALKINPNNRGIILKKNLYD